MMRSRITAILVGAAIMIGGYAAVPGGSPPVGQANVWVEVGAGACTTAAASPITYEDSASPDRRCGSLDEAWDQMSAGQTARIVPGIYGPQNVTGDKASVTFLIGNGDSKDDVKIEADGSECRAVFAAASALCVQGAFMHLENVTLDSKDVYNQASAFRNFNSDCGGCSAHHTTLKNVDIWGDYPNLFVEAPDLTWSGGSWIKDDTVVPPLDCQGGGQPINVHSSAENLLLEGLRINPMNVSDSPVCDPHVEAIRLQNVNNVTIRDNWFNNGDYGSGYIFTGAGESPQNITIINNIFETLDSGSFTCQCTVGTGWYLAYNTIQQAFAVSPLANVTAVGNFGVNIGCAAISVKNVWIGSGSCGTDTFIGATSPGWDSNGRLNAGSPAIDAAETPSASDHCTDSATVNARDFEGTSRPQGASCDAGADERTP